MNTFGLYITGTGTDVGKTYVSGFALAILRQLQCQALYYKPIQCGPVEWKGQILEEGDAQFIQEVLGHPHTLSTWRLSTPASPHRAFPLDHVSFDEREVEQTLMRSRKDFRFVLLEGAGGIRVPINEKTDMTDLVRLSSFPVLIVAAPGLGTLNHTLLTIEHLTARHIPIAGFVFSLNHPDAHLDPLMQDNYQTIQQRSGVAFLGTIPFWNGQWTSAQIQEHPLKHYLEQHLHHD